MADHRRGYFIVRGGPGQGKTAFSCHLVKNGGYVHHFINRTGGRTDPRLILRSLLSQLPLADRDEKVPESLSELTKIFEERLPLVAARRKKLVIVIDALDELPAETVEEPPYLVADGLPDGVYFVVTSRPGDRLDRLQQRRFAIPPPSLRTRSTRHFRNARRLARASPMLHRRKWRELRRPLRGTHFICARSPTNWQSTPLMICENCRPRSKVFFAMQPAV